MSFSGFILRKDAVGSFYIPLVHYPNRKEIGVLWATFWFTNLLNSLLFEFLFQSVLDYQVGKHLFTGLQIILVLFREANRAIINEIVAS